MKSLSRLHVNSGAVLELFKKEKCGGKRRLRGLICFNSAARINKPEERVGGKSSHPNTLLAARRNTSDFFSAEEGYVKISSPASELPTVFSFVDYRLQEDL